MKLVKITRDEKVILEEVFVEAEYQGNGSRLVTVTTMEGAERTLWPGSNDLIDIGPAPFNARAARARSTRPRRRSGAADPHGKEPDHRT